MIASFGNRLAQAVFEREAVRELSVAVQRAALRKLLIMHAATSLGELRVPPGNRLEKLQGDRADEYSIRVNDQWRVCFRWYDNKAHEVSLVDYH